MCKKSYQVCNFYYANLYFEKFFGFVWYLCAFILSYELFEANNMEAFFVNFNLLLTFSKSVHIWRSYVRFCEKRHN